MEIELKKYLFDIQIFNTYLYFNFKSGRLGYCANQCVKTSARGQPTARGVSNRIVQFTLLSSPFYSFTLLLMTIAQLIAGKLETLSPDKQQEVLDFVEFLQSRANGLGSLELNRLTVSALEAAGDLVGCIEGGPSDLSTNKVYMEGFGEE